VSETNSRKTALSLKRLLPFLVIVGVLLAFVAFGGGDMLSFETLARHRGELMAWAEDNMALAVVVFWLAYVLTVAFSLPGAAWMTLVGGFLFGTWAASVYVVTAATVGAVGIFLAARYAFRDYFAAKGGGWVKRFESGFHEDAMSYMLVLRLVPIFPFWMVNLAPALIGVPLRTYVIGTFIGIIPGSWVYCSVGNGLGAVFDRGDTPDLGIIFEPQILVPIIGLAVLSLIPVVYKRYKGRGANGAGQEDAT